MDIPTIVAQQKTFYSTNQTRPLAFRLTQLKKLERAILAYTDQLYQAFEQDLHKSAFETYATEIGYVLQSIRQTRKKLARWMRPKKAKNPTYLLGASSYSIFEPLGTVLIIGPFNYPFQLVIEPLIGAIAAGNTVIIKPSEYTPHVTNVLKDMIHSIFEPEFVAVVSGAIEETTTLLHQPVDHIFFTGSPAVGKIVMKAASERLIPVTLELGGKSPAIVAQSSDIQTAAEKIAWGKFLNAGQTCVAPDYVLVEETIAHDFTRELTLYLQKFYGLEPKESPDFGRLATEKHASRFVDLLQHTTGKVILGGEIDAPSRYVAPTIVTELSFEDALMQEELFGPVLPILTYRQSHFEQDVLHPIQQREKPLALYLFTKEKKEEDLVLANLSFGGGVINDTLLHLTNEYLPFGGVGQSGMGHYHGHYSFLTFSHQKAIVKKRDLPKLSMLYPPYTDKKFALVKKFMK